MHTKFVLFDFDGVIADSFHAAYTVVQMMCPHVIEAHYRERFEGNIHDWEEPSERHTAECRTDIDFNEVYIPKVTTEVQIFPGMREVIVELAQHHTLAIVSSTLSAPVAEFLSSHGLSRHFVWIMGHDIHKSKVEKMNMLFEKYSIHAEECVFITDTLGDMREAEKAGVGAIGVTWGFHARKTLERGMPFRLIDTPQELSTAVSDYFAKQGKKRAAQPS
jgi:phosphoglycolate phosphatase